MSEDMKVSQEQGNTRKIIHVDMDAFFASVEQRDNPALKGKPLVVGGDGKRSVVAAASYEARKYGVFSAMPMSLAKQKCRDLVIVPHRFQVYKEVSGQIRSIFQEYTDLVEPLSLDEAYLDVTQNKFDLPSATIIAREIKKKIEQHTSLTCTAGISINKFLAKVASGLNKPNGLTTILPSQIDAFLDQLPIHKFFGVGKVTAEKMKALGVGNGADLKRLSLDQLTRDFGKSGHYYYQVCRGVDDRPVSPSRIRKSISVERTFEENIYDQVESQKVLENLCQSLVKALHKTHLRGRTLQLKWRYPDFTTPTRNKSFEQFTDDFELISLTMHHLFVENVDLAKGIRLLGVGISSLDNNEEISQLSLDL